MNENIETSQTNNDKIVKILYIIFGLMIFFTTTDVLFNITQHLTLALMSSILSAILIFFGTFKLKVSKIEEAVETGIETIRSSFNKSNIILSILDVICSFIALFTGFAIIGLIFRFSILLRIVIFSNKLKTITRIAQIGSLVYLLRRCSYMNKLKLSKSQWFYFGLFAIGVVYGIFSIIFPVIAVFDDVVYQIAFISGYDSIVAGLGIFAKGREKTEKELAIDLAKSNNLTAKEKAKIALKTAIKTAKDEYKAVAKPKKTEENKTEVIGETQKVNQ